MAEKTQIPFLDLVTPHREMMEDLCEVFRAAASSAHFIGGPMVEDFEREFAKYCEADHCIGVGSGTDALRFALIGAGIGHGEIVVTVPNTFIATTEAISQAGATPDFVDIDPRTYNMDPAKLREYCETQCSVDPATGSLTHRKRGMRVAAVVPVHLYGQPADMDAILEICEEFHLTVLEDSCQAHGARYLSRRDKRWKTAGSMGKAAAFSFYPGKNLGACGEAGAVTTNDAEVARTVRMLRDHGQSQKYYHDIEGYNGRLDAIQAGILSAKLKRLKEWTTARQKCAAVYRELLADSCEGITIPYEPSWSEAVYHLYVVCVPHREQVQAALAGCGVGTGIHYPIPLHLQKAYAGLGYQSGDFPVSEKVAAEILSLPMYPNLTRADQERVADAVREAVAGRRDAVHAVAAGE